MILTKAISRLILAGTFDKFPNLRILLAHSGGTFPFLAGRLDSCVAHDPTVRNRLKHEPSFYLKKLYYDGVGYHAPALKLVRELVGAERIMFGYTD
jgi:aminocarboxymuconate-semialdehyde decarboxylase